MATYRGHAREMCPHAIGFSPSGKEQALFYQFEGETSQGPISLTHADGRWKCMAIAKLQDVQARDGPWHSRSPHTRPQTCVDDIDVEVDY